MKASTLYRITAVLLLLFAVGHTLGFRQTDPKWGVDALLGSMRSIHFDVQGFNRSYWDFYVGFGLAITIFLAIESIMFWLLGSMTKTEGTKLRPILALFFATYAALAVDAYVFFFFGPLVTDSLIALCLGLATVTVKPSVAAAQISFEGHLAK